MLFNLDITLAPGEHRYAALSRASALVPNAYRRATGSRRKVSANRWNWDGGTASGSYNIYRSVLVGAYDRKAGGSPVLGEATLTVYRA